MYGVYDPDTKEWNGIVRELMDKVRIHRSYFPFITCTMRYNIIRNKINVMVINEITWC